MLLAWFSSTNSPLLLWRRLWRRQARKVPCPLPPLTHTLTALFNCHAASTQPVHDALRRCCVCARANSVVSLSRVCACAECGGCIALSEGVRGCGVGGR